MYQNFFMKYLIVFFCLLFIQKNMNAQNDTLFYAFVKGTETKGVQKMWVKNPNEYGIFYQYNDRGRGDSIYATIKTNEKGLIINVQIEGVDYFKAPYKETFEVSKDSATDNTNDNIKTLPYNDELFVSFEAPGMMEPVVKYLATQKDSVVKQFNGGTVSLAAIHEKNILFKGKTLHLFLYELYFDKNTPPVFFWFDADKHFFAQAQSWFSMVRKGYESLADTLNKLQEIQSKGYYGKQMKALSNDLPGMFAVTHVRVYDAANATMQNNMTVLVKSGKIISVGSDASLQIPQGYTIIDGTNKTLMPGLWDMHAHYDKSEGLSYLTGGVTHVRDMGNSDNLPLIKDEIANNEVLGPDISYMSGFIDQAGPFEGPTGTIVHSLDEAIKAVDKYAQHGYQQIKLYSSIDPKWVAPIAAEAHKLGLRVCGHIPSFMTATQAINAGYNEITHINMIMLNFMGDTIDTRGRGRLIKVGERGKDLDFNGKEANDFVQLMKQKNISFDPTMHIFSGFFQLYPGDTDAAIKPIVSWMPADEREDVAVKSSMAPVSQKQTYIASFDKMMQMLKKLYDNNILIIAGTDGGEAFALENELEMYVQAGIPPLRALQCATYNAAKDCALENTYGIKPNVAADFILIDGNPGTNISDIRRVEWVVKNNKMYHPKQLLGSIGWGYYY
jgi:imidazolonepropionase-like amidohydrolase